MLLEVDGSLVRLDTVYIMKLAEYDVGEAIVTTLLTVYFSVLLLLCPCFVNLESMC